MNFKTMATDTLTRILNQVSDELKNRSCRSEAEEFQLKLQHICTQLQHIKDNIDMEPRRVKHTKVIAGALIDMQIFIDGYWAETK